MKHLLFAIAILVTFIVTIDLAFLHGLTAFVVSAITGLF